MQENVDPYKGHASDSNPPTQKPPSQKKIHITKNKNTITNSEKFLETSPPS